MAHAASSKTSTEMEGAVRFAVSAGVGVARVSGRARRICEGRGGVVSYGVFGLIVGGWGWVRERERERGWGVFFGRGLGGNNE